MGPSACPGLRRSTASGRISSGLAKDVKASIAKGEPVEAARQNGPGNRSGMTGSLFDDYNRRNVTAAYSEFEWDQ